MLDEKHFWEFVFFLLPLKHFGEILRCMRRNGRTLHCVVRKNNHSNFLLFLCQICINVSENCSNSSSDCIYRVDFTSSRKLNHYTLKIKLNRNVGYERTALLFSVAQRLKFLTLQSKTKTETGRSVDLLTKCRIAYLEPNSTTRTPATNTGYKHPQQTPPTDKNLPHPNILTCRDVGLWHCDVANL